MEEIGLNVKIDNWFRSILNVGELIRNVFVIFYFLLSYLRDVQHRL